MILFNRRTAGGSKVGGRWKNGSGRRVGRRTALKVGGSQDDMWPWVG